MFTFDPIHMIVYGAVTGFVFGFLLQKANVTRYHVILGQFLLTDFTVAKVMFTAIVVGAAGIYGMITLELLGPTDMHIKSAALVANGLGGLIFGVGMMVLGYCPGTGVAAIGDGSRHAIFGLLGMIFGGAVYAETYPYIQNNIVTMADQGKVTLASVMHVSPWLVIAGLAVLAVVLFVAIEQYERRKRPAH